MPFAKEHNALICLEYLNDIGERKRLRLAEIERILKEIPELRFTYDVGHAVWNGEDVIDDSSVLCERLTNMHVHTIDPEDDHRPIYEGDAHYDEILQHARKLLNNPFELWTVVFEYNLFVCRGETEREKIIDFLDTMKPFCAKMFGDDDRLII